jgi:hypothetical protein
VRFELQEDEYNWFVNNFHGDLACGAFIDGQQEQTLPISGNKTLRVHTAA